jgi:transcriptional regulator with GAF, ATPase, and Fis domain
MDFSNLNENKEKIIAKLREEILQKEASINELNDKNKELQGSLSRLKIQYEVTKLLVDATSFDQVCEKILRIICEALNFQRAFFWAYNPETKTLSCSKTWNVFLGEASESEFETLSKKISFPSGVGLPGRLISNGKPDWVIDVVTDKNFPRAPVAEKLGIHSAFGFPILIGYKVFGVMEFFTNEFREPDEKLLDLMVDMGNLIAEFNWRNPHSELLESIGKTNK